MDFIGAGISDSLAAHQTASLRAPDGLHRHQQRRPLVQKTFADHLLDVLGWQSVYAFNDETFGPQGTLGRADTKEVVLLRDLRAAIVRLNPQLPVTAVEEAAAKMARHDFSRSLLQHNKEFYGFIRDGVPVSYRDANGALRETTARVLDFQNGKGADGKPNNRFVAVRELKITGLRSPSQARQPDAPHLRHLRLTETVVVSDS